MNLEGLDPIFNQQTFHSSNNLKIDDLNCYQPICKDQDQITTFNRQSQSQQSDPPINGYQQCPNSKSTLGQHTWNFLHTMAAYYPQKPTPNQKSAMLSMIDGLAQFYPCKQCRIDFQRSIKTNPPNVDDNKQLTIWFCKQHNLVNLKLGKQQFDCEFDNLQKRWKTGYEHCQNS